MVRQCSSIRSNSWLGRILLCRPAIWYKSRNDELAAASLFVRTAELPVDRKHDISRRLVDGRLIWNPFVASIVRKIGPHTIDQVPTFAFDIAQLLTIEGVDGPSLSVFWQDI